MGLEYRNGQYYYYKKARVNGRVTSLYVGKGDEAKLLAELIESERESKQAKRQAQREQMEVFRDVERDIDALLNELESIKNAHFRANGYGKHKGQWRKKR